MDVTHILTILGLIVFFVGVVLLTIFVTEEELDIQAPEK
jgi:hypothetical protein